MFTKASTARGLGLAGRGALVLGLILCGRLAAEEPMPASPPAEAPGSLIQPRTLPPVTPEETPAEQATQETPEAATAEAPAETQADGIHDPNLQQVGCASCGLPAPYHPEYGCGCGDGHCVPGHTCLHCDFGDGYFGHFLGCLYGCLCCPDPCYEPRYLPVADSGFFIDAARPHTQMRIRGDFGWNVRDPDRAEWFWPRVRNNTPGNRGGRGPSAAGGTVFADKVDYDALDIYTEAATDTAGAFVETRFIDVFPDRGVGSSTGCVNIGDMVVGAKALFLDCELIQLGTQFKTYIPTGNFLEGAGAGHVSLEPALLSNLKIGCKTYLQSEFAYWIPVGGDPDYQGCIFHYHFSLNHRLWCPCEGIQLIGTGEMVGYHLFEGAFTNPDTGALNPARTDMLYLGAGLRLFICEKYDIGAGGLFAVTDQAFEREEVRVDFRWRF